MYKLLHTVYSEYVMDDIMEMKMSEVDGACNRNLLHMYKEKIRHGKRGASSTACC